MLSSERSRFGILRTFTRVIRISTIFVAICMVLVAASLGLVLYSVAALSMSESGIVALTALTFMILYNAVSMRLRDRSDVGGQIEQPSGRKCVRADRVQPGSRDPGEVAVDDHRRRIELTLGVRAERAVRRATDIELVLADEEELAPDGRAGTGPWPQGMAMRGSVTPSRG